MRSFFRFVSQLVFIKWFGSLKKSYRLYLFNQSTCNDIASLDVELSAIKGKNISILKGTYISGDSTVGSYTFIGFNSLISKSEIGNYCSVASNVNIGHGEHPIENFSTNGIFIENSYQVLTSKDCIIGNDVWIGVNSTIKRGVRIGDGAIVGANSFVNKDVPPFAIVVGSPGRIAKYRFDEKKIKAITDSHWWDYQPDEVKLIFRKLEKDY